MNFLQECGAAGKTKQEQTSKQKTQTLSFGSWDSSVAYSGTVWRDYLQELKDGEKIVTESLKNDNPYIIVVTKKMVRFLLLIPWMIEKHVHKDI